MSAGHRRRCGSSSPRGSCSGTCSRTLSSRSAWRRVTTACPMSPCPGNSRAPRASRASPTGPSQFAECLATTERPDWILADTFQHWAPAVATAHKGSCAMLQPSEALIVVVACGASKHGDLRATSCSNRCPPRKHIHRWHEWHRDKALFVPVGTSGLSIAQRITILHDQRVLDALWLELAFLRASLCL